MVSQGQYLSSWTNPRVRNGAYWPSTLVSFREIHLHLYNHTLHALQYWWPHSEKVPSMQLLSFRTSILQITSAFLKTWLKLQNNFCTDPKVLLSLYLNTSKTKVMHISAPACCSFAKYGSAIRRVDALKCMNMFTVATVNRRSLGGFL